jgi:hypothetical protein
LSGDLAEQIDQGLVRLSSLRRKARHDVAEVGPVERRVLADRAGEKALAQRAEGNEADSKLFQRWQHLLLGFPPPQGIFALKCRDLLNRMRTPDGLHAGFRKPEMPDLAFPDQVLYRSRDILDRHIRVDAVLIEQIDGLGPEPLERSLSPSGTMRAFAWASR